MIKMNVVVCKKEEFKSCVDFFGKKVYFGFHLDKLDSVASLTQIIDCHFYKLAHLLDQENGDMDILMHNKVQYAEKVKKQFDDALSSDKDQIYYCQFILSLQDKLQYHQWIELFKFKFNFFINSF